MSEAFLSTPRFSRALELINCLELSKYRRLLTRVAEKLHIKGEKAFSNDELVKLESAFGLGSSDVELLLETIEFILLQAVYYAMKPTVLQQQLKAVILADDKCEATVNAWITYGKSAVEKMKRYSFAEKQLRSVDWDMNLQLAQASRTQIKDTNATFHLNLDNNETGKTEKLLLEFSHEELLQFYNKLEIIQSQLDSLS